MKRKRIISLMMTAVFLLSLILQVTAVNFDQNEFNSATTIPENQWTEFAFNQDILLKVDVTRKGYTSIYEIDVPGYENTALFYVFTHEENQENVLTSTVQIPGYIGVPHILSAESSYIKLSYSDSQNANLRGETIRFRLRTTNNTTDGWQNATLFGLNEEHTIRFRSMDDHIWYKLVVPYDEFGYAIFHNNAYDGCFISELYRESDLELGNNRSIVTNCLGMRAELGEYCSSDYSLQANTGADTYYVHLYPVPFYDGILKSDITFSTTPPVSLVPTSFGGMTSDWALEEIEEAYDQGLIPEVMEDFDLSKKVSRAEFTAIAVQLYETLANQTANTSAVNPFTDIDTNSYKPVILKGYELDIAQGMTATTFEPNTFITREQLATMLCRVVKKYSFPNWTYETDGEYYMQTDGVQLYDDDADISSWAKPSVYFMRRYGVIQGVDGNTFAPKNTTDMQNATGYASATREQAIILAKRIFENDALLASAN